MIEIAGLLVLGILAQWLAWRIRVPAILPLILIGLLVGPISTFFTPHNEKFIDEIILRFGTLAEERDWKKSLLDQYVPNKIEEYEQGLIQCSGYDCHWTNGYETLIRTLEMDAFVETGS